MSLPRADRNLLLGLLALQYGFVSREDLLGAVSAWLTDKTRDLGEILLAREALQRDEHELLAALVSKHLDKCGGDAQQSLAPLSSLAAAKEDLHSLGDAEIDATLATLAQVSRPNTPAGGSAGGAATDHSAGGQRFRVLRPHARGGLGEVFVAQDTELHREVALKEILPRHADDAESRARFVLEAEITGGLEHPGIVPVYGLGRFADGRPYYAMRFIKGDSLKEAVDRFHGRALNRSQTRAGAAGAETVDSDSQTPPAGEPEAREGATGVGGASEPAAANSPARLPERPGGLSRNSLEFRKLLGRFVDVCDAIEYAHSRGVLHRDLKPGNIMLGKYGETLVVDWGLAKIKGRGEEQASDEQTLRPASTSGSTATQSGLALGTPAFMSPEQADGRISELGPEADVYSLGATLYYLLTGRPPFSSEDVSLTLRKVRSGEFPSPRAVAAHVPRPLEAICLKAMSRLPQDRYPSPAALAADVERWLADERVSAYREPLYVAAARYFRRRKALAAALAVLLVVAPLATAAALFLVAEERAQRELDRRTAEMKAQTAAQVTAYLIKTFESADPLGLDSLGFHAPGERTQAQTLRRVLDGGAELLEDQLLDQPAQRASLLDAIGNSYRSLGDWERAHVLLTEGHALRQQAFGDAAAETLASLHSLARLAQDRGDYAEAAEKYKQVIAARERLEPPVPLLVAETKFHLAWMLFNQPLSLSRPQFDPAIVQEAEQLLAEVLRTREELLPPNHRDIGHALAALASVKGSQSGQAVEAATLAGRAAEVFRQSDQESLLGSVVVEYLAAEAHRREGRFAEAEEIYQKVLALARKHLGPRHPMVLLHMANMCGMYRKQGDLGKLLPMVKTLRGELKEIPALRSLPVAVDGLIQHGDLLRGMNPAEANELYREALSYAQERPEENAGHIETLKQRLQDQPP